MDNTNFENLPDFVETDMNDFELASFLSKKDINWTWNPIKGNTESYNQFICNGEIIAVVKYYGKNQTETKKWIKKINLT